MGKALHEGVVDAALHHITVVVVHLMVNVDHWGLDGSHRVAKQIDGHHGQGMGIAARALHVLLVVVLHAQIAAEAQQLGVHPRLLYLYEDGLPLTIFITDGCAKINAEDGEALAAFVGIFIAAHVYFQHLGLQQGREDGAGDALVLHEILEHYVVDRVGY